jgi:hypothetical protein
VKTNPLLDAVRTYDVVIDSQAEMMHFIGGCEALETFDEALSEELWNLTLDAWSGTRTLSPRATQARLNLIWEDFVKAHRPAPPLKVVPEVKHEDTL